MGNFIKFDKSSWGFSGGILLFNKIYLVAGISEAWGIGIKLNFYDRSLIFEIFNLYAGIEIWHRNYGD